MDNNEITLKKLTWNYKRNIIILIILIISSVVAFYNGYKMINTPLLSTLLFHEVVPNPEQPWEITEENLESIINSFKENNYTFVDPERFPELLKNGFEGRNVLVTFDDGVEKEHNAIKQLYTKFGIKSVCFLIESKIDHQEYMTTETLLDLQNNYGTLFGLHGKYHKKYTEQLSEGLDLGSLTEETRLNLSKRLGKEIRWLSFPFGNYNQKVLKEIKSKTKIELAFTIEAGNIEQNCNPFTINRYMYQANDTEDKLDQKITYALLPPEEQENGKNLSFIAALLFLFGLSRIKIASNIKKKILDVTNKKEETN